MPCQVALFPLRLPFSAEYLNSDVPNSAVVLKLAKGGQGLDLRHVDSFLVAEPHLLDSRSTAQPHYKACSVIMVVADSVRHWIKLSFVVNSMQCAV